MAVTVLIKRRFKREKMESAHQILQTKPGLKAFMILLAMFLIWSPVDVMAGMQGILFCPDRSCDYRRSLTARGTRTLRPNAYRRSPLLKEATACDQTPTGKASCLKRPRPATRRLPAKPLA